MKTRTTFERVLIESLPPEVLAQATLGSGASPRRRVLVVDDHRRTADALMRTLELNGYHAKAAYTGEDGLALAAEFQPSIMISDVGLPTMDGITLGEHIATLLPKTQIVLMCECLPQNPDLVAWVTLKKPFQASELLAVISLPEEIQSRGA